MKRTASERSNPKQKKETEDPVSDSSVDPNELSMDPDSALYSKINVEAEGRTYVRMP